MADAHVEIERKFVLSAPPAGLGGHPSQPIRQGYLAIADDGVEVRIRERGERATLTVKSGPGHTRVEEELELDARRFRALWPLTEGRRLAKVRHLVPLGDGLEAEVDVYAEALAGLVTAEVEFPDEAASAAFAPPDWLGMEVTGDARYANQALATAGAPPVPPG
jgi:adenylate cyclase